MSHTSTWKILIFDLGETLINFNLAGKWYKLMSGITVPNIHEFLLKKTPEKNLPENFSFEYFHEIAYPILSKPHDVQQMPDRVRECLEYFHIPLKAKTINSCIQFWFNAIKSYPYIYPEVKDTLTKIKKAHFKLSLWSDTPFQTPGKYIEYFMKKFKIRQYFSSAFFSGDYFFRKPNTQTMKTIQDHHQCQKEEMVYIGNIARDIQTGKNFGIDTIWINRNDTNLPENTPKPTYTCKDITGILKILKID